MHLSERGVEEPHLLHDPSVIGPSRGDDHEQISRDGELCVRRCRRDRPGTLGLEGSVRGVVEADPDPRGRAQNARDNESGPVRRERECGEPGTGLVEATGFVEER